MLECSVAGISLSQAACHSLVLGTMQRGDERAATLVLEGPDGEEAYEVTLRLAARGPAHVEFAFVTVPPLVRSLLEQVGPIRAAEGGGSFEAPESPPPRRLMLDLSAAVFEVTRCRRTPGAPSDSSLVAPPDVEPPGDAPIPLGWLLLVIVGIIAFAALGGVLLFR